MRLKQQRNRQLKRLLRGKLPGNDSHIFPPGLDVQLQGTARAGKALAVKGHPAGGQNFGIGHLLGQYPSTLSVGERQRVAIASALAHGPSVVLADEPTAALDPGHAANVLRLFAELARQLSITVVMVTHNLEQAREAGFALAQVRVEPVPGQQNKAGSASILNWTGEAA